MLISRYYVENVGIILKSVQRLKQAD